jgi:glycosyltransferase involved in cell wall biosynthesis
VGANGPQREGPQLSIVLSTLGNYAVLGKVLDGYERQDASPGSFELLVVSDLAEPDMDAVVEAVRADRRPYPVRLLRGERPGLSANRNAGWHAARAPLVLFTDNDTIPAPSLVGEHLGTHARFPEREVAVAGHVRWARGIKVTPFMKWLDRSVQFDYGSLPGERGSWAHLYGANSSIKRAMLEFVGGYDEERLPYLYEDLDWGYRAREHGLRVIYNRRAIVDHWRPMTVEVWQKRAPMLAAAEWQFCQLHPDMNPWYYEMFSSAAAVAPGGRRSARLVRWVPLSVPWLGTRVWDRAALHWRQEIAPHFLTAWERASAGGGASVQPDVEALLSERASQPGGS